MHLAGKLASWGVVGAIHPSNLVKATDELSGASLLVDTSSTFCIIPHSSSSPPCGPLLKSANGQRIPCWGKRRLTVQFYGRGYSWWFLLAAVDFHIIGVDFLKHFKLIVDVTAGLITQDGKRQADIVAAAVLPTTTSSLLTVEAPSPPSLHTVEALGLGPPAAQQDLAKPPAVKQGPSSPSKLPANETALLSDFADVLNADGRLPPSTHGVEHHIVTKGRPPASYSQVPPPGLHQTSGGQGRVSEAGERRHRQEIRQRVGQPVTHGPEKRRYLAALW